MTRNKKSVEFLKQAYSVENDESQIEFYKKWADDYDQQMQAGLGYISPREIAAVLAKFIDDKAVNILDIGCGTGLTAQALCELGFTNLDGLDFSAEMIGVAEKKGIYRQLLQADLNQKLAIKDESYHAIISSGTFTHGHVGSEPLDELFRLLKPQGLLACTVHQALWQSRGFENKFKNLQNLHQIKRLHFIHGAYFEDSEPEGWFCVYQKL